MCLLGICFIGFSSLFKCLQYITGLASPPDYVGVITIICSVFIDYEKNKNYDYKNSKNQYPNAILLRHT